MLVSVLRFSGLQAATVICGVALAFCAHAQQGPSLNDPRSDETLKKGAEANAAGKYEHAVKIFKGANKLRHNVCYDCYVGLAVAYSGMGDAGRAEENSIRALSVAADAPQRAGAHTLRGSVLLNSAADDLKRLATAEEEFRKALSESKEESDARFGLGVALLKEKKDEEGTSELKTFLSFVPAGSHADQARNFIANPRRARERFAPEFEVTTLQGERLALGQLSGKVVVLDFWATWCLPCRAAVPELKDLLKKYPREKLVLISISADEIEGAWRDFIAKKGMDWPQFLDTCGQLQSTFGVKVFPTYLVIDGEGIIRQEIVGTDPQRSVVYRLKDTLKSIKQLN